MGQRRAGRHDLGAADDHAGVGFFLDVHEDVGHFVGRFAAVGGRIDQRVVEEQAFFLRLAIPSERVFLVGRVELGIGSQRAGEARLVVGRSSEPAIRDFRPLGDRVARTHQIVGSARDLVELVREAAVAGIGGRGENRAPLRIVQRVIHPRQHPRRVAEGRMRGHVLDALAVNPDLARIADALQELLAGERPLGSAFTSRLGCLAFHPEPPLHARIAGAGRSPTGHAP